MQLLCSYAGAKELNSKNIKQKDLDMYCTLSYTDVQHHPLPSHTEAVKPTALKQFQHVKIHNIIILQLPPTEISTSDGIETKLKNCQSHLITD